MPLFGKKKKDKKKNKKEEDEANYFRPQPVMPTRSWGTTTKKKDKKKKSAKQKQPQPQSQPQPEPPKKEDKKQKQPQPKKPPSPKQNPKENAFKRLESEPVKPSSSKPPSKLIHSQTEKKLNSNYPNLVYNNQQSQNRNPHYAPQQHQLNESLDSNISGASAMSAPLQQAPLQQSYNHYQQPAPLAYGGAYRKPQHRVKNSEGMNPVTGQPEVVGGIEDYRQQQKENKMNYGGGGGGYPSLQHGGNGGGGYGGHQNDGGGPVTGGAGGNNHNHFQPPHPNGPPPSQSYYNQNQQSANDAMHDPSSQFAANIGSYNPSAPNVPEESSSSDEDMNALLNGGKFVAPEEEEEEEANDKKDKKDEVPVIKPVENNKKDEEIEKEEKPKEKEKEKAVKDEEEEQKPEPVKAVPKPEVEEVKIEEEEEDSDDDGGLADWLISIGFKRKKGKLDKMVNALNELGLDTMEDLEDLLIDLHQKSFGKQQKQFMDKIQDDLINAGIKYAHWIKFSNEAQKMIMRKIQKKEEENNDDPNNKNNNESNGGKGGSKPTAGGDINYMSSKMAKHGLPQTGFIVMQSEEAQQLENLRNAMSHLGAGISGIDELVLSVEENERLALALIDREFNNLAQQIEQRKNLLQASIASVSDDKSKLLLSQNANLRSISAEYEETMHSFNNILASTQHIKGKNEISKRTKNLYKLVSGVLSKNHALVASNMVPGCTPLIGFHCNITPICLELNNLGTVTWGNAPNPPIFKKIETTDWSIFIKYTEYKDKNNNSVVQDPILAYEIQCVLCENEENLLLNFENAEKKKIRNSKKEKKRDRKNKNYGIIIKHTSSSSINLVGFVVDSRSYVIRIRCSNRNGWSIFSKCILCKTKKKKKRKARSINKISIIKHRGHNQEGAPNNLLFSNDKLNYQSLSVQDFINELENYSKMNPSSRRKEFNDWLVFDLGSFIELIQFKIKYDVHYRWGNIPQKIYIDIANYDDHEYSKNIIEKYKPLSYDDDFGGNNMMSGVLIQLRNKRQESEKQFESIWHRLAVIECKKKQGWQEFNLYENIDESKRKGQYIRIQFVKNFDCNIEQYCKFIVEQISFVGIQYDD